MFLTKLLSKLNLNSRRTVSYTHLNSIYNNLVQWYERPWGFYVSPELGMDIHPVPYQRLGFHVAVYYSYATNQTDILTYSEDGRNSMGVRVGVCF